MNFSSFLFKRFLAVLPLVFFLPLMTFVLMHYVPGNYFDSLRLNPQISPDTIKRYEELYHLNEPVLMQYGHWLKSILRLDFGYSFSYKQPVLNLLASRFWNTLALTGTSFLLAWFLAVALGLNAGLKRGGLLDKSCRLMAYLGLSIPGFFLCLLLMAAAATWTRLPLGGMESALYEDLSFGHKILDRLSHMVIPVSVLTFSSFAYLFRFMRAQTLTVTEKDFVFYLRTLRVPERSILYKHVARNAVNPMITLFGLELPALFSGAALVEIFTGWPGLGSMMLQAVRAQDLFLVLGNMMILSVLLVAGNLIADILLATLDPRIRLEGKS
ncbi:MAG TPA: ABC transporter permease [Verrucomicrobiae bacterium]|jgi:peptide/nickel transport system permease protein|nr:ABC transporter permease [Verrucomicrobiae bacterium]